MGFSRVVAMALAALMALLVPAPAAAVLPGAGDPAFRDLVARWLAADEAGSLPGLAALATAGSPSAQLLLAVIDKTPSLQGPWLSALPRGDRVALMRAPGGLSGRSWAHAAAETVPLARYFQALWHVEMPPQTVLDLARVGESRAARAAVVALQLRERRGLAELSEDPDFPAEVLALAWLERGRNEATDPGDRIAGLHPGDVQRIALGHDVAPDDLADFLLGAPVAAPIAAFCDASCPESRETCALAAQAALGSVMALWMLGSPVETLVPSDEFAASPKGRETLLRRVLLNTDARGRRAQIMRAESLDACFGGALKAEAERYRAARNGGQP